MATLEKEARLKRRKENIQKTILEIVKAAGILSVAILAPNALKMFGRNSFKNAQEKSNFNASVKRLLDNGLINFKETQNGKFLRLTEKGETKLRQLENYNYQIIKPKKWDGRWRIIIFDIKEGRKGIREKLRLTLKSIGFIRLQNSVWVFPYDCEDMITLLKADFKIGKDVLYVIAEKIENDRWLKQKFNL